MQVDALLFDSSYGSSGTSKSGQTFDLMTQVRQYRYRQSVNGKVHSIDSNLSNLSNLSKSCTSNEVNELNQLNQENKGSEKSENIGQEPPKKKRRIISKSVKNE